MVRRQEQVEATHERILAATVELWLDVPYDEMTVGDIASSAGVTRQTVLRHFGSKEGLALAAVRWFGAQLAEDETAVPGTVDGALDWLVDRYEVMGDANVRFAALEGRLEAADEAVAAGRSNHRAWIDEVFADTLEPLPAGQRRDLADALYAATDVAVWKLLRRDFGRSVAATRRIIGDLVGGALRSASHRSAT